MGFHRGWRWLSRRLFLSLNLVLWESQSAELDRAVAVSRNYFVCTGTIDAARKRGNAFSNDGEG
jgi:hypothetical protein